MTDRWSRWKKCNAEYWMTTYRALNPFMPTPVCPNGHGLTKAQERFRMVNPATEEIEFKCLLCGARWATTKTYD